MTPRPMKPRANPFRADRLDALPYCFDDATGENLETLTARLETLRFRAAIIGAHGHGKTTLLHDLENRLQTTGWSTHAFRLNIAQRDFTPEVWRAVLPALGERDMVLLDGAEQLSFWRWHRFLRATRHAGGVLITSHCAGLLPTLIECRSSPQLLALLIARLDPSRHNEATEIAQVLFARHNGNLRDALRELYDDWT